MADDIWVRLCEEQRKLRILFGIDDRIVYDTLYSEAADEIERLRQQVDSLSKQLDQAVSRD